MMGKEKDGQVFLVGVYGPAAGTSNEATNKRKRGVAWKAGIRKEDLKDQKPQSDQRRDADTQTARGLGMGAKQLVESIRKS